MKLIIGLGNPGWRYRNNRHNIGIKVVGTLAKKEKIKLRPDKRGLFKEGRGRIDTREFILAVSGVFMNLSAESVCALLRKYSLTLEDILVVCDDLDLELGRLRIRPKGSSGGHKGLKSIIENLNSDAFARLRIGIGRPKAKKYINNFVLSDFTSAEAVKARQALNTAIECCQLWLRKGVREAMERFNQTKKEAGR